MNRHEVLSHLREQTPVVAPSMLKCDFGHLADEVRHLCGAGTQLIHWDVMDGVFVPNLSYGAMVIERVRKLTAVPFEAHLMIQRPDLYLDSFLAAGCDCITFHIEAVPEPLPLLRQIREADRVAGLAINPGTPAEQVLPFLSECDMVLVMSVEPGFGGQKFMPQVLPKLQAIRASHPEIILSIDGGIALPTIAAAATAGASVFVAGSAVFNEPDYAAAIAELASAASSGHIQGRC